MTTASPHSHFCRSCSRPLQSWSLRALLAAEQKSPEEAIAAYDANVATYRQTVLTAFQQVEDNLAALSILEQEAATQAEAVQSARLSTELTLNQYKAGTVNYLNVVIVQAAQFNSESTAVNLLGQRLIAAVALVQALGGGWDATQISSAK